MHFRSSYFVFLFISAVPFKYESLLQDYLHLGCEDQYAPVYPMYCARPSKRRQLSEQSLESTSEQSSSEQSLNEKSGSNEQLSTDWNEWSSDEFGDLVIGDTY